MLKVILWAGFKQALDWTVLLDLATLLRGVHMAVALQ